MKRILICIDYDPTAQKVAEVGFSYARELKAEVILLHVISNPLYYSVAEFSPMGFVGYDDLLLSNNLVESLKEVAHQLLDKTKSHLGEPSLMTVIKEGDFADAILDTAAELAVDIIVMGSHGRKWLEKILVGSVTEKVLRHSSVPLFLIPTYFKE